MKKDYVFPIKWKESEMAVWNKWREQTERAGHSLTWKIKELIAKDIK